MRVRILGIAVLSVGFLPGVCWGQMSIPIPDSNGKTWWYGPNGITPGPVYTPRRSTPVGSPNLRQARRPVQANARQFEAMSSREFFAPNLQIHFKLVRVGGATGARLTRAPSPNSPTLHVLVNGSAMYLEPNDVILNLDSVPIRQVADVLNHHSRTTITFVDHRSGRAFNGVMTLPIYAQATYSRRQ